MLLSLPAMKPDLDASARMQRAKERLYVVCQLGGWGGFFAVQMVLVNALRPGSSRDSLLESAIYSMIILLGLLLSHAGRFLIHRWGWKQLGWAELIPRVLGLSLLLTVLWSGLSHGYLYGLLRLPWTQKISLPLNMLLSLFNGLLLVVFWFCLYFIYHAFERLQRMQVEGLQLAANVKEAELRALKSQVNPHFLFNSLNSLRALIEEDAPRAREAVTRLANILRYSLQSGQLPTVPFAQELQVVEDYLALEKIRHEDRLQVRWAISDEVRDNPVQIPPMLLQTLVENAVKYGIGSQRAGGELFIGAAFEGAALRIRVTNPGEFDGGRGTGSTPTARSTGVGLRNASERLTLLYGAQATLELRAIPEGCVTADVLIPLAPAMP